MVLDPRFEQYPVLTRKKKSTTADVRKTMVGSSYRAAGRELSNHGYVFLARDRCPSNRAFLVRSSGGRRKAYSDSVVLVIPPATT